MKFLTKNKKVFIAAGALAVFLLVKKKPKKIVTKKDFEKLNSEGNILSPIKGKLRVTSKFGNRIHPITKAAQFHNGADIVPAQYPILGAPIQASFDGVVEKVFSDNLSGNAIVVTSGAVRMGYAHLQKPSTLKAGQQVKKGQILGYLGNSGRSTAPHLHLTMKIDNVLVDPVQTIKTLKESTA